jgi:hypothetical protein
MNKKQLVDFLKEELNEAPVSPSKAPADVIGLDKAQSSSNIIKSKAKAINSITELPGAFEIWFKTLGFQPSNGTESGKTKISKSQIIQAITNSLNNNLGYK